jgi:hypothetical protein
MADEKHLLLRIAGDYSSAGLEGEIWQTDIRLACVFGSVDAIGTLPSNWDPVATTISRTESDWTIEGNWKIKHGIGDYFLPDDYLNDQALPAIADWFLSNQSSDQCRLQTLALYPIGAPTGNAVPAVPYAVGTPCLLTMTSPAVTGSATGVPLPLQDSIAVSHKSGQIGPRGRGRMFLPMPTSACLTGGKIQTSKVTQLLDAHIALLEALSFNGALPGDAHVRPIVTGKPYVNYGVIGQVRVGNIVDTQRRRRNRLLASGALTRPQGAATRRCWEPDLTGAEAS